jgi:hypothetical protein
MFVEIKSTEMIVGVKYAVMCSINSITYSTGTFKYREGEYINKFDYFKQHCYIKNTYFYNEARSIQKIGKCYRYYAFVSKKDEIQRRMEQRALDKILKRLINDELFVW